MKPIIDPTDWELPAVPKPVEYFLHDLNMYSVRAWLVDDNEEAGRFDADTKYDTLTIGQKVQYCINQIHAADITPSKLANLVRTTITAMLLEVPMYRDQGIPYVYWDGCYTPDGGDHISLMHITDIFAKILEYESLGYYGHKALVLNVINGKYPTEYTLEDSTVYVPFRNAYFSTKTGKMVAPRPHREYYSIRHRFHVKYDPHANCPLFQRALESALPRYEDQSRFLDMMALCFMSEKYSIYRVFICVGDGENGKSSLLRFLQAMLGRGNYATNTFDELDNEFLVAAVAGKTACISTESQGAAFDNIATLRKLTSGDPMNINPKHQAPRTISTSCTFVQAVNELPNLKDQTRGTIRRIERIEFTETFDSKETWPDTMRESESELSGALNLILPRMIALSHRRGLECPTPEDVRVQMIQSAKSPFENFIQDMTESSDVVGDYPTNEEMYGAYARYVHEKHLRQEPQGRFFKMLRQDYGKFVTRRNGKSVRVWTGITLKKNTQTRLDDREDSV